MLVLVAWNHSAAATSHIKLTCYLYLEIYLLRRRCIIQSRNIGLTTSSGNIKMHHPYPIVFILFDGLYPYKYKNLGIAWRISWNTTQLFILHEATCANQDHFQSSLLNPRPVNALSMMEFTALENMFTNYA